MPAYLVIDLDIHDVAVFDEYARAVSGILEHHGGRYLVRRRAVDVLEGDWHPKQLTVIEFQGTAHARAFYESREFREIVGLRLRSARTNLVLVEEPQGHV
jgi:uncharacterized protein (DUF1330 family)